MATTRTHRETTVPRTAYSAPTDGEAIHTRIVPKGLPAGVAANDELGRGVRPGECRALAANRDRAYPAGSPLPCR
ncbi:hypothetical protein [Nocardia grenadensis]|uniref:hypothetical protein n=1 Tax=Nocardia grenadensis TaxID=931537 RepID=UPI0007A4E9D8|nr:hypothetical protein [Nocardia grenadensis]